MRSTKRMIQIFTYVLVMAISGNALAADDEPPPPCYVDKPDTSCEKALELVAPEYEWLLTCGGCTENRIDPNDPDSPLDPFLPYKCITDSSEDLYLPSNDQIHFYAKTYSTNTSGGQTVSEDDMPIECGVIAHCLQSCTTIPGGRICNIDDLGALPFTIDVRHVTGPACRNANPDLPPGSSGD